MKICKECNRVFTSRQNRAAYCSEKCRKASIQKRAAGKRARANECAATAVEGVERSPEKRAVRRKRRRDLSIAEIARAAQAAGYGVDYGRYVADMGL